MTARKHKVVSQTKRRWWSRYGSIGWGVVTAMTIVVVWVSWQNRTWDGSHRMSLVFPNSENGLTLVSLQPLSRKLTIIEIDSQVRMPLVKGYGMYRVGVVGELSTQEGLGSELLVKSLEQWWGIDVYGVVSGPILTDGFNGAVPISVFWHTGFNQVNKWDLWRFWYLLRQVPVHQIMKVDLRQDELVEMVRLPDGTAEYELENRVIDKLVQDLLQDELVRLRGLEVAVLNTTGKKGLAAVAARLLINLGYDVVSVGDNSENLAVSEIWVDEKLETRTQDLAVLKNLFTYQEKVSPTVLVDYTTPVVIKLGNDYDRFLNLSVEK